MMKYFFLANGIYWLLVSCTPSLTQEQVLEEAMDAIASDTELENVISVIALADCVSPSGNYTTEVHSYEDDYAYFKQVFSYRPEAFEAVVWNAEQVFVMNADSARFLLADTYHIDFIKGHEFHEVILNLTDRFQNFRKMEEANYKGRGQYKLEATDISGNTAELYFDKKNKRLHAYAFKNPGNTSEVITVELENWQNIQGYMLPGKIIIDQSGNMFTFDYQVVEVNNPDFEKIDLY